MIFSDNPVTLSSCINVYSGTSSSVELRAEFTYATGFRHISTVCRRPTCKQLRGLKCDDTKSYYYNVINVVKAPEAAVCRGSPEKHIVETGMLPPSVQDNQKRPKVESDIFRSASRCGEVIISLPYKAGNQIDQLSINYCYLNLVAIIQQQLTNTSVCEYKKEMKIETLVTVPELCLFQSVKISFFSFSFCLSPLSA